MAKKKAKKAKEGSSRSPAAVGRQNTAAGKGFEREIVMALQLILEPNLAAEMNKTRAELKIPKGTPKETAAAIRSETTKKLRHLQGLSQIKRGEQRRGAHEPDVVSPTSWWIEVSRRGDPGPLGKLAQAERELKAARKAGKEQWTRPVACYRKTGSPTITVALWLDDLMEALGAPILWTTPQWSWNLPVVIGYDWFLKLVEDEYAGER
jgi:hypothetical protein